MAVDVRRFPWIRRLAADYAFNFHAVEPFFAGDPRQRSAWADAIRRTQAHTRDRSAIAAVLNAQQTRRGAPAAAVEAAGQLADAATVAVVTGQQAGLFGGPLFTLLKALTALRLAQTIRDTHGVPAVAIFWIEAEDHDWNEVRSCGVLDADLSCRTIELADLPGANQGPVARVQLDDSIASAVAEL